MPPRCPRCGERKMSTIILPSCDDCVVLSDLQDLISSMVMVNLLQAIITQPEGFLAALNVFRGRPE